MQERQNYYFSSGSVQVSIGLFDAVCIDKLVVLLAGSAGTGDAGGCASHAADRRAALLGHADGRLQLYAWQRHL